MTIRLIFTADDFGLAPALNAAVALAHRHGLLSCASLMPAAPAFSQAVALAHDLPELCLGVHLTLIQGKSLLPPPALPHLVDAQGNFSHHPVATGWRYFWQPRLLPAIRRELAAQIEAALAAGFKIWHLNSHLNLHLHPRIFPLVVALAREYRIPALRLSRENWRTTLLLAPDRPLPKLAQGLIFTWLCRRAEAQAQAAGLITNQHLFGLLHDGRLNEDYLLNLVPYLKPGVTEICCHPALFQDPELHRWAPHYQPQAEYHALLSTRLAAVLQAAAIELTDYRDLVRST